MAPARITKKTTNQMVAIIRSTSSDEHTADMFTAKSRYTYTSRGVQTQTRGTREIPAICYPLPLPAQILILEPPTTYVPYTQSHTSSTRSAYILLQVLE